MTIKYGWLVEQQVLLTAMIGEITNAEYQQWADETQALYDAIPHDHFHIIIDGTQLQKIPSVKDLTNVYVHPKRRWIIVYGLQNRMLEFFASMVIQLIRTEMKILDTLDEAIDVLKRVDQSLPPITSTDIFWLGVIGDQAAESR